jgi:hypothetical protein
MKIKSIKLIKVASQEEELITSNPTQEFIKQLTLKVGNSNLVKKQEGDSYDIYVFGSEVNLGKHIMGFIASAPVQAYLTTMNGQIALFLFKNG